jgi:ribonuclease P protein component
LAGTSLYTAWLPFALSRCGASREAYLSTQQDRTRPAPRLPVAHGHRRRPSRARLAPRQGPQAPVRLTLGRLTRRAEFLRVAAQGRKFSTPGLVLQALSAGSSDTIRLGFTCSRKVGNAVARNRARRRLKAAAAQVMPDAAAPGHDYVLIGKTETLARPYALLLQDLRTALKRVGALRAPASGASETTPTEGSPLVRSSQPSFRS